MATTTQELAGSADLVVRVDDGVWFLTAVGTVDAPGYVVGSAEGRYLVDRDGLVGAAGMTRWWPSSRPSRSTS